MPRVFIVLFKALLQSTVCVSLVLSSDWSFPFVVEWLTLPLFNFIVDQPQASALLFDFLSLLVFFLWSNYFMLATALTFYWFSGNFLPFDILNSGHFYFCISTYSCVANWWNEGLMTSQFCPPKNGNISCILSLFLCFQTLSFDM